MLYALSRALAVLSLYMQKLFIYLPIDIISLLLRLPTLYVLSSFLSLSRSFLYGYARFVVSFFGKILDFYSFFCFFFLEIRFDGFRYFLESFSINGFINIIFFMLNVMYFDTYFDKIAISFNAFFMYVWDFEFF